MLKLNIQAIADITQGNLTANGKLNDSIDSICFDSRLATHEPGELFVALTGKNNDGHQFIAQLAAQGTRNFLVEKEVAVNVSGLNLVQVNSTLQALHRLATYKRKQFNGPLVAITGSNGKTIVKEWLTALLSVNKKVLANPKSFNSQLGVPLSVWPLNNQYDLGVFEAGISRPSEMDKLEKILSPEIGIFTNIGPAHDENFINTDQKVLEKLKLFAQSKTLIFDADDKQLGQLINGNFKGEKLAWSRERHSNISVLKKERGITIKWKGTDISFDTNLLDDASFQNIVHVIIAALYLGQEIEQIQEGLNRIRPIKMRLELKKGIQGNYIIDDTYNNDLAGLTKALNFMDQQRSKEKKTLILSDFIQSKVTLTDLTQLNELLSSKGIQKLIGVGPLLMANQTCFTLNSTFFTSTEDLIQSDLLDQLENELILIKGARRFAMERVSLLLSEKGHKTTLEVNLDALRHNLNFYRSLLKPETQIMAVIKAFAYGSGSTEVARLLEYNKVGYLAVAYADEGVALRKEGIKTPIMVMNPANDDAYAMIKYELEPEVYNLSQLHHFQAVFKAFKKPLPVHLVINTGMNRLGFNQEHIAELKMTLTELDGLSVKSIFSHLAASDDQAHEAFSLQQIGSFSEIASSIQSILPNNPMRHILNSGGITRFPEAQFEMVRLGIGLHGVEVNSKYQDQLQKPAVLKTVVSQIRKVKAGESVGYGRKGKAMDDMLIAVIAIGYADGYLRVFSNGNAYVLINQQKAKTIGNVCMDMTMVDVTGLNVKEGDEVTVFGESPTVSELASWANTIPYEILTNVSSRVKRVFYAE